MLVFNLYIEMKLIITRKDIQFKRIEYKNNNIFLLLQKLYPDYEVLIWNFWYILKHPKKNIIKIYPEKIYFLNEKKYYDLFSDKLFIPKIIKEYKIWNFNAIEFENIRYNAIKFKSVLDISIKELVNILNIIHSNKLNLMTLLHWNLHHTNFFFKDWKLWIFDFVSVNYWEIESDYAILYFNSYYNDDYLEQLIKHSINNILIEKVYYYTLLKIKENIKYNVFIKDNKLELQKLKKDLIIIKNKLLKYYAK